MRRKDREITDKKIIDEIFNENIICRVAFNGNPYPYIVPMNYGYRDNKLYLHSAKTGLKIDKIKENNSIAFEIESKSKMVASPGGTTMKYRSVIGTGKIRVCDTLEEQQEGLKILMVQHGGKAVEHRVEIFEKIAVICIDIDSVTGKQNI